MAMTYIVYQVSERDCDIAEGNDDIGPDRRVLARLEEFEEQ
jgi:hypothetical protein